uniref:Uncharacterized protein n=1 Tax=Arundo donax TaxID=35708 RepID=A0A0A8YZF7_ARUDO
MQCDMYFFFPIAYFPVISNIMLKQQLRF